MTATIKSSIERRQSINTKRAERQHKLVMGVGIAILVIGLIANIVGNLYFNW